MMVALPPTYRLKYDDVLPSWLLRAERDLLRGEIEVVTLSQAARAGMLFAAALDDML